MCDYIDEPCDVWAETPRVARKPWRCSECGRAIAPGTRYVESRGLYEGCWSTTRTHGPCLALVRYIAHTVCGQSTFMLAAMPLRDRVREHYREDPTILRMYRDGMSPRREVTP